LTAQAPSTPRLRGLPLFAFAVGGLLLGHGLSYVLAIPDPYHRDLLLDRTGHAYLPAAGQVAMILVLAGVAAVFARAWSGRGRNQAERFTWLAGILATVQVAAFAGQEVLERLVARSPLTELAHDHVLVIGILVQVGVALIGATALRWLARLSARVAAATGDGFRPPMIGRIPAPAAPSDRPYRLAVAGARNVRAPPPA
jgi:hypothetical protein